MADATIAGIKINATAKDNAITVKTESDPVNSPAILQIIALGLKHSGITSGVHYADNNTLVINTDPKQSAPLNMPSRHPDLEQIQQVLTRMEKNYPSPETLRPALEDLKSRMNNDAVVGGIQASVTENGNYIYINTHNDRENSPLLLRLVTDALTKDGFTSEVSFRDNQIMTIKTQTGQANYTGRAEKHPTLDQVKAMLTKIEAANPDIDTLRQTAEAITARDGEKRSAAFARVQEQAEAAGADQPKVNFALEQAKREMKPYAEAAAKSFKQSTNVVLGPDKEAKLLEDLAQAYLVQKQKG